MRSKTLSSKTLSHIEVIVQESLRPDGDRAGEIHVVLIVSVLDTRCADEKIRPALRRFVAVMAGDQIISIDRKMRPMLLDRSEWDQDDTSRLHGVIHFLPGHARVRPLVHASCPPFPFPTAPELRPARPDQTSGRDQRRARQRAFRWQA